MPTFLVRPVQVPDDYPRMAAIFTAVNAEPVTVELLAEEDSRIPAPGAVRHNEAGLLISHCRDRLVAVSEDGNLLAYAHIWRAPWSPPGVMFGAVSVDPAHRKQGMGSRLLQEIEAIAQEKRASWIYAEVREHIAADLAWVQRHGYEIERHQYESTLDLTTFDASPFAGAVEKAESSGIRFTSLAETGGEAMERQLYDLAMASGQDIPGTLDSPMPFSQWRLWNLEGPQFLPDGIILALDGDRLVGTSMLRREESGAVYTEYTGVDRAYRGRGLALALKLRSVAVARRLRAPYMRTNNDSLNGPMLAVNRRLGYQPEPGLYRIRKQIG